MAKDDKDDKDATAEAPKKKSKKLLMIIVIAVVVLGGGGAGAFFMLSGDKAEAAPVKGTVVTIEEAITINLAESHYLKLGFALQLTEEAGDHEINTSEALDLAIDQYTGAEIAELQTEKGRTEAKDELLEKIEHAYNHDGAHIVMGIYFTQFVTQ